MRNKTTGGYAYKVMWTSFTSILMFGFSLSSLAAMNTLEEVVVTAQKRQERVLDVPVAVQVVSGESLQNQNISNLEDMKDMVPGLHVGTAGLTEQLFIRGIGSGSNGAFEPSTGIFLDGVFLSQPRLSRLSFLDTQRVEVLKGPQSTLFGKGSIAGAVNIVTARPEDEFGGDIVASYSFDDMDARSVEGFVTGPVSDRVRYRIAGKYYTSDGYFKNTQKQKGNREVDEYLLRASLEFDLSEALSMTVIGQRLDSDGEGRSQQVGALEDPTDARFPLLTPFIALVQAADPNADFGADDHVSTGGTGANSYFSVEGGNDEANILTVLGNYDLKSGSIKLLSSYIDLTWNEVVDADATTLGIVQAGLGQDYNQFSTELRYESDVGTKVSYIAGVYYETSEDKPYKANSNLNFNDLGVPIAGGTCPLDGSKTTDDTWAVFAQFTAQITENLSVTAGGRYQNTQKDLVDGVQITELGDACAQTTNPTTLFLMGLIGRVPFGPVSGSREDKKFSPSLTVQYDFDDAMVYASYRTGLKAGGFSVTDSGVPEQFGEETARSIEIGVKSSILEGRGNISASIFNSEFDDLQVSTFETTRFIVGNAAQATSQGVEVDTKILLTDNLTLGASAMYLDAKYDSFPGAACYSGQTVAEGCVAALQDLKGKDLQYAPEFSGTLDLEWRSEIRGGLEAFVYGSANYSGEQNIAPSANPIHEVSGTTKVNLRAGISSDRWEAAIIGRNLTDKMVPNFGFNLPLVTGAYIQSVDRGRTIALQLRAKF